MRTILITGSSGGIGAATAVSLTRAGNRVLITGRSDDKLRSVHSAQMAAAPRRVAVPEPIKADLSSLAECRRLARTVVKRERQLDVLINNAAVQPRARTQSADGHELTFAVNHLAHQLLTVALAPLLAHSGGRVVTTSSDQHAHGRIDFEDLPMMRSWSIRGAYARSKLANILFTAELRRRTGLPATSFHPGSVCTDLNREMRFVRIVRPLERLVMQKPEQGAATAVWLATSDEGGAPSASYYVGSAPAQPSPLASDSVLGARLWDVSTGLIDAPKGSSYGR